MEHVQMRNVRGMRRLAMFLAVISGTLWNGTATGTPVGTHIFGQVAGNPGPEEVRFDSPVGFSGVFRSDSVSAGGGTAAASASLARGELKGLAVSPTDPVNSEIAHAIAQFRDEIRILDPGGGPLTTEVDGTIRMRMSGILSVDDRPVQHGGNSALSRADLDVVPTVGPRVTPADTAIAILVRGVGALCPVLNCVITSLPASGAGGSVNVLQDVTVPFTVTPLVDGIAIEASLDVSASNMATADLFSTARLFVDLPDGYTFTSASGVLLTDRGAQVPGPGTLALLASGLVLMGYTARRRRARHVASPRCKEDSR